MEESNADISLHVDAGEVDECAYELHEPIPSINTLQDTGIVSRVEITTMARANNSEEERWEEHGQQISSGKLTIEDAKDVEWAHALPSKRDTVSQRTSTDWGEPIDIDTEELSHMSLLDPYYDVTNPRMTKMFKIFTTDGNAHDSLQRE